jgi:hypothetical protein
LAASAQAQVPTFGDYCQADPVAQRVADAVALLVPVGEVEAGTAPNTYRLKTYDYDYTLGESGHVPICPEDLYYGQQRALQGRTGFLVGPRTLVTAAHLPTPVSPVGALSFHPANYAVIFGWRWEADGAQPKTEPGANCALGFDPEAIPADKVYFFDTSGREPIFNTLDGNPSNPSDYMSYQLDRVVVGAKPLPLRRSGAPLLGDTLLVPGHPDTLPLKLAYGGRIQRVGSLGLGVGEAPDRAGSSGSPVFNLRAEVVETIWSAGNGGFPFLVDPIRNCRYYVDSLQALGARANTINNGPIAPLVAHVPRLANELIVTPLNLVRHEVTATSITNAVSYFDVSLAAGASGPVNYTVRTTDAGSNSALTVVPDNAPAHAFTIAPGATQRYRVEATSSASGCESSDVEVRVTSQAAGSFASVIPHRFEILRGGFEVLPDNDWKVVALAAPYPTHTLTLRNPSPVPVTLTLTPSANWLRINNATSATVNLAAAGSSGDSATAVMSIASTADMDVAVGATANAKLTVAAAGAQCMDRGSEEIAVSFTNGVQYFTLEDVAGNGIPPSTTGGFGDPLTFTFDLSGFEATVGDIDLLFDFQSGAGALPANQADEHMKITLKSPHPPGLTLDPLLLWNRDDGTSAYFPGSSMLLDDATAPPLGGHLLAEFNGESMDGEWELTFYSNTTANIFPVWVTLRMQRQP